MLDVCSLLDDLIERDFGHAELSAVRALAPAAAGDSVQTRASRMVHALATVQRTTPRDAFMWAGEKSVPALVKAYPAWARQHSSARTVFLQLSQIAPHVVGDLFPDSPAADLWEDMLAKDHIRVSFDGAEELAWVLEGLAHGLAKHFGEGVVTGRGTAPVMLADRRIVEIRVVADRRTGGRSGAPPVAGLSSVGRVG